MSTDWSGLYRAHYAVLVRYVYRKIWDEERSHELVQEAFLRALDADPPPAEPRAWLFTVAGNLARDQIRATARRRDQVELVREESDRAATDGDPLDHLVRRERVDAARRALESLGEGDREALLLWAAGLSYDEIAQRTELARGSIGTTLSRARRRLREAAHHAEERDAASH